IFAFRLCIRFQGQSRKSQSKISPHISCLGGSLGGSITRVCSKPRNFKAKGLSLKVLIASALVPETQRGTIARLSVAVGVWDRLRPSDSRAVLAWDIVDRHSHGCFWSLWKRLKDRHGRSCGTSSWENRRLETIHSTATACRVPVSAYHHQGRVARTCDGSHATGTG
ncbi:hypothetical protein EI94DRAFT_1751196, partial [Lactarius quietus]